VGRHIARAGEFGFACGMNMVHGRLVVEPNGHEHEKAMPNAG